MYTLDKILSQFISWCIKILCHLVWSRHLSMHVNLFHSFLRYTNMDSSCNRRKVKHNEALSHSKMAPDEIEAPREICFRLSIYARKRCQGTSVRAIHCIVVVLYCLSQYSGFDETLQLKCTMHCLKLFLTLNWIQL